MTSCRYGARHPRLGWCLPSSVLPTNREEIRRNVRPYGATSSTGREQETNGRCARAQTARGPTSSRFHPLAHARGTVCMDRTTRGCICLSIAYKHVTEAAASQQSTPDKSARGVPALFYRGSCAAAPFIRTRSAFLLALPTAAWSATHDSESTAASKSAQQSLLSVQYPRFESESPVPTPNQEGRT